MKTTGKLKYTLTLLILIACINCFGQFTETTKIDSIKFQIDSIKIDSLTYCFSASEIRNIGEATFKFQAALIRVEKLEEQRNDCLMLLKKEETISAKLAAQNVILNLQLSEAKKTGKILKIGCVSFGIITVGTLGYLIISD